MFRSTLLYLGIFTFFISIFSLLNILFCYYFNTLLNVNTYYFTLFLSSVISFILIFFNKKYFKEKINFFEKLFFVIVGFFYFPILIAIPYYLSIYDITFINSYFEAISGFTATGFSIFENTKKIDEPLLIWRSSSQWLGGLYFLYSLFLLTGTSKVKIKNIYSNYETVNLPEIKSQYTKVLTIYLFLTVTTFLLLTSSGVRLFEGFNLSMTITSAGGFIPANSLNEIIKSENQKLIFAFCMLFPFFSLYLIYNIFSRDLSLSNLYEDLYLLILLMFILILAYIFFNNSYEFSSIVFSILSSLSNIGLSLDQGSSHLSFLYLILVIIGGSSFSTSSGLKFIKLYSLFKFSLNEIYLIVKPLYVSSNTLFLSKYKFRDDEINNYFLTIVFFICGFFVLSGILSLEQINFKDSLTLSILTITNTVNSSHYNLNDLYFANMQTGTKLSLIFFMIIGKVELMSFLILIKKYFIK